MDTKLENLLQQIIARLESIERNTAPSSDLAVSSSYTIDATPPQGLDGPTIITNGITCSFRCEPGETECHESVWSEGKACKKCAVKCYRAGWDKAQVDVDNTRLVEAKIQGATS